MSVELQDFVSRMMIKPSKRPPIIEEEKTEDSDDDKTFIQSILTHPNFMFWCLTIPIIIIAIIIIFSSNFYLPEPKSFIIYTNQTTGKQPIQITFIIGVIIVCISFIL